MAGWLCEQTLNRLREAPPRIIVVWASNRMDEGHPITRWIAANYRPIDDGVSREPLVLMERVRE